MSKSETDQFNQAYQNNGQIFVRRSDLIQLLGWTREKHESAIREVCFFKLFHLEAENPCYSIRKIEPELPDRYCWETGRLFEYNQD